MKLLQDIAFFKHEGRPHKKLFFAVQIEAVLQKLDGYATVYHFFSSVRMLN